MLRLHSRRRSFLLRIQRTAGALALLGASSAAQAGTVETEQKIGEATGGFAGVLDPLDAFGGSVAALGDLDGDGIEDVAVGAPGDDDGGSGQGAVWILFLDANGAVARETKISETTGGFGGTLDPDDGFGHSVAALGDLDGNGIGDLAVGAPRDDGAETEQGAVWILYLNSDATVANETRISEAAGGFGGVLDPSDFFGSSVAALGDLDGNGVEDLAVGAVGDDDGGFSKGAVWILFLDANGTVASETKLSDTLGTLLDPGDFFGCSLAALCDLDGNGIGDLAVGAVGDDDGLPTLESQGAVWILFLEANGTATGRKISETVGGFGGALDLGDDFGSSVTVVGDLDGDGIEDLAVGAPGDDDGGLVQGAVWILFLNANGTVASEAKISALAGDFGGTLDPFDRFGSSVAALGDLDGDGIEDLAVGAVEDDAGDRQGAAWILFLRADEDITPPVLSCPASVLALDEKGGPPGEFVSFTVTATDGCDRSPAIVCVPPSGSFFPRGTTMVTCTATDDSGNVQACTFPVTVRPSVRPR